MEKLAVYLTPQEAELFKEFREYQTDFVLLKLNGVFGVKDGSICIHFDHNGKVRKIESHKILFNT